MEAKRQTKTINMVVKMKKKKAKEKAESQDLNKLWKQFDEQVRKDRHDIYIRIQNDAKARQKTPPKYRR
jgi:iron uptake system EfeUOB component EfeO/EfeM